MVDSIEGARKLDEHYDDETATHVAFRRFVNELAGTRDEPDVGTVEATYLAIEEYREMRAIVDEADAMLATVIDNADPKMAKARDIVEYALGGNPSGKGVVLSAKEVARAADITERYAYKLMDADGLPDEYPFFLTREQARERQYGSMELDGGSYDKALVVDVEGARASPFGLNSFNTRGGEGVIE